MLTIERALSRKTYHGTAKWVAFDRLASSKVESVKLGEGFVLAISPAHANPEPSWNALANIAKVAFRKV